LPASSIRPLLVAYLVTSYQPSDQLRPLVSALKRGDPDSAVVICQDSSSVPLDQNDFSDFSNVHVVHSVQPVVWGDISQETSRWLAFRWILENLSVDWVMVLSGQDYPIARLSEFHDRLRSTHADAIIHGQRIDESAIPEEQHVWTRRYLFRYHPLPSLGIEQRLPESWRRPLTRVRRVGFGVCNRLQPWYFFYSLPVSIPQASRVGRRAKYTPFDTSFPCWHHEPWYALSRTALVRVMAYLDENPGFVAHYARTIIPVESATGTVIFNDPGLIVDNVALHAIRWSNPLSGRPDELTIHDIEYLRASRALFARKFPSDSGALLDELDKDNI
jgi:hypothetical protein